VPRPAEALPFTVDEDAVVQAERLMEAQSNAVLKVALRLGLTRLLE